MKLPFVWRRTAEANERMWKDRAEQWRGRAETAERKLQTQQYVSRRTTELFAECFDEDTARRAAERLVRFRQAVARARAKDAVGGAR
ncbi:hypothetical protein ACIQSP_16670 [Streptomyces nigra]|uniref:hypothetical protein n=1 Tax=Streptomyces nigra TaxID=1827580 RepID=UPI003824B209